MVTAFCSIADSTSRNRETGMIIAKGLGRAGNQLFVVAALLKLAKPHERLVLYGFEPFKALLGVNSDKVVYAEFPARPRLRWWYWIESVLRLASLFRLTKIVSGGQDGQPLEVSKGLLPITLFDGGYCQDEHLVDLDQVTAFWRQKCEAEQTWLAGLNLGPHDSFESISCFVHVRRGDYLHWPSPEFPAALEADWYLTQIDKVRKRSQTPVKFLLFTDDYDYCRNIFGSIHDLEIVEAPPDLAFLAMSRCDAGILSASSFSWWAARLAATEKRGPFIGPTYWCGWRKQEWMGPPGSVNKFLEWG
jgi:hypothetical protein